MKIKTQTDEMLVYYEDKNGVEIDVDPRVWIDYIESLKKLKKLQAKLEKQIKDT